MNVRTLPKTEPALLIGALQAFIALAAAFGLKLSAEQMGALVAAMAGVLSVVLRQRVSPSA